MRDRARGRTGNRLSGLSSDSVERWGSDLNNETGND